MITLETLNLDATYILFVTRASLHYKLMMVQTTRKDNPMTKRTHKRLSPGAPPMYDKAMKKTAIWMPVEMIDWLKAQPVTLSQYIRDLVEYAIAKEKEG